MTISTNFQTEGWKSQNHIAYNTCNVGRFVLKIKNTKHTIYNIQHTKI